MLILGATVSWARHAFGRSPFVEAPASVERLIANVFLLNGFGIEGMTSINVPSWSISCELMAYTLFCALVFLGRRAIVLWLVLVIVNLMLIARYSPLHMNATDVLGLSRCAYGFGLGVAAKVVYLKYGKYLFSNTAMEVTAVTLAFGFVALTYESPWSLMAPFVFFVVVLVFALEAGRLSYLMRTRFFQLLGKLSFTTYMCHYMVVTVIFQLALLLRRVDFNNPSPFFEGKVPAIDAGGQFGGVVVALVYLTIVVVAAWALHLAVEEPFRKRAYARAKKLRLRLQGAPAS
jgi:peptidoglycan/LPS O-acetylase OafA/YrhL